MQAAPQWRAVVLAVALAAGAVGLCSCSSVKTHPFDDYVGPKADPAEFRQAVQQSATSQAAEAVAPSSQPAGPEGPLVLTVEQAIVMALQNNRELIVERFNPAIRRTAEEVARSEFDPVLTAEANFDRKKTTLPGKTTSLFQDWTGQVGLQESLPTGTTLDLTGSTAIDEFPSNPDQKFATNVSFTATQSLLRGFGIDVNLATIRQAAIDTLISQYELRGVAESLVATTEETYWDYVLSLRQIEIFEDSLEVAQEQLNNTQERVNVGQLAETELAAAQAEVALRREDLITARATMARTRLQLLQLISPSLSLDMDVRPSIVPVLPQVDLINPEDHVQVALKYRPDLNQARLQVNRGDLEIVKTRNGLLPKLDMFVTLGRTGYANTLCGSIENLNSKNYEVLAGLSFEYPLGNRAARAQYDRSLLSRDQAIEAVSNLAQLAELDVRDAYITVNSTREQVTATEATRILQQEKLRAETERFNVGKSTTLLVGIAQRDLLSAQIAEVQAKVAYIKSIVELYRLEGSLLQRRGIASPGGEPVEIRARDASQFRPPPGA